MLRLFKNRCYNGGNRHNYQSRHEEKDNGRRWGSIETYGNVKEWITLNVYVKDICIWCGKEIKK